jgi:hypothetical protein
MTTTRWLDAIAPEAKPAPEIVLIRWCVKLGRLTRWPSPFRHWLQRRIAELLLVAHEMKRQRAELAEVRVEAERLHRALDEYAENERQEAQAAEAVARSLRNWRTKERH